MKKQFYLSILMASMPFLGHAFVGDHLPPVVLKPDCPRYIAHYWDGKVVKYQGKTVYSCYAKNYIDLLSKQVANNILKRMVFVKGGTMDLYQNKNRTVHLKSFYIDSELVPYQAFNRYLKESKQWHHGDLEDVGFHDRLSKKELNGLYQAGAYYPQASGFCQWLSQKTGLPFALPTLDQWYYAATSRGTNWEYPTNNGKLEIGVNFPKSVDTSHQKIGGLPVNSLGIHQLFNSNMEWTQTPANKVNYAKYFVGKLDQQQGYLAMGTFAEDGNNTKIITNQTLETASVKAGYGKIEKHPILPPYTHFRCVINTDKPLT